MGQKLHANNQGLPGLATQRLDGIKEMHKRLYKPGKHLQGSNSIQGH